MKQFMKIYPKCPFIITAVVSLWDFSISFPSLGKGAQLELLISRLFLNDSLWDAINALLTCNLTTLLTDREKGKTAEFVLEDSCLFAYSIINVVWKSSKKEGNEIF